MLYLWTLHKKEDLSWLADRDRVNTALKELENGYRQHFGGDVQVLGGQVVEGSLPREPDTFVVTICLTVAKKNNLYFDSGRDEISYSVDMLDGRDVGVCRIRVNSSQESSVKKQLIDPAENILRTLSPTSPLHETQVSALRGAEQTEISKLLEDPKAAICSACGKVAKPWDKRVAIARAIVLLIVPVGASVLVRLSGLSLNLTVMLCLIPGLLYGVWLAVFSLRMAWNRTCPNCRKGTLTPLSASERQQLLLQANEQPYSKTSLYEMGVLFDIDELGGGFYGWEAYKIFFNSLDPKRLTGCTLLDGDTKETLAGHARQYCIALQSPDPSKLSYVKETLSQHTAKGLLPPGKRFIEGNVTEHHSLAVAGEIDSTGNLIVKGSSMIGEGWVQGTAWTVIKR